VLNEQLDHQEISDLLGLEPTKSTTAGEITSKSSGRKRKYSGWFLESTGQVESKDARDHFAWILDRIAGKGSALKELASRGYLVDMCCRWDSACGQGGPSMDPQQMIQLGELGIELWFDIYFDQEARADA